LLAQLPSGDERQILYALDLLSHTDPKQWREHIDSLIQHRSSSVRARTIAVLVQTGMIRRSQMDNSFSIPITKQRVLRLLRRSVCTGAIRRGIEHC